MDNDSLNDQLWFALRVRSRSEKMAAADLEAKGFRACAATAPQSRQWADRVRTVEMPMFPGYIFCRFSRSARWQILRGAGVAGIVGVGGVDFPLTDEEMNSVFTLARSGVEVVQAPYLSVGTKVRVRMGPLAGVVGLLQRIKNELRLVLSVEFLQRAVAVEVDADLVEPIQVTYAIPIHGVLAGEVTR